MKAKTVSPRAGSHAFRNLQKLHAIGGQASALEWTRAAGWTEGLVEFEIKIIRVLTKHNHVFKRGDVCILTDGGMEHIGASASVEPYIGLVAGPGYVAPMRTLSARYRPRLLSTRDGALDYRDIPSRHGDQLIEYGTGLNIAGAAKA